MPSPATLPDDLLNPIRPERPAGEDLRSTGDWSKIKGSRPNPYDSGDRGEWAKANAAEVSWPQLLKKTSEALGERSKDLQLAVWLTEANTRINGFPGIRDSLNLIRELLVRFWDSGLFPSPDDEDVETRVGPLQWLNEKLAELVRAVPVTATNNGSAEYSYAYFLESRKTSGSITAAQFDEAAQATSTEQLQQLSEDCRGAQDELASLEKFTDEKFGPEVLSFTHTREALAECRAYLENELNRRRPKSDIGTTVGGANVSTGNSGAPGFQSAEAGESAWMDAEKLVREGKVSEGLDEMTRLAATASSGRVRFHRKLLLADICLSSKRDRLAKMILEELAELIEKHHLEEWESPQIAGAVWSRLYRCCKNEQAGIADADRAAQLFLKLCRLDPWQALACNDGNK